MAVEAKEEARGKHLGWHLEVCVLTDEGFKHHEYSHVEIEGPSHITPYCATVLYQSPPPKCSEISEFSRYRICKAFEIMQKENVTFSEAMVKAWPKTMEVCIR